MRARLRGGGGFTVVEMVIVLVVLGVVAATSYRLLVERAADARVANAHEALTSAARAQEQFRLEQVRTGQPPRYADSLVQLQAAGLVLASDVLLEVGASGPDSFCMYAWHWQSPVVSAQVLSTTGGAFDNDASASTADLPVPAGRIVRITPMHPTSANVCELIGAPGS